MATTRIDWRILDISVIQTHKRQSCRMALSFSNLGNICPGSNWHKDEYMSSYNSTVQFLSRLGYTQLGRLDLHDRAVFICCFEA